MLSKVDLHDITTWYAPKKVIKQKNPKMSTNLPLSQYTEDGPPPFKTDPRLRELAISTNFYRKTKNFKNSCQFQIFPNSSRHTWNISRHTTVPRHTGCETLVYTLPEHHLVPVTLLLSHMQNLILWYQLRHTVKYETATVFTFRERINYLNNWKAP